MWTHVLVVTALLAVTCHASYDNSPSDPQSIDQLLTCFLAGPGGSRVPEPLHVLYLNPRGPTDVWNLPEIQVKEPFGTIDINRLSTFLNASTAMNMVTSNTMLPPGTVFPDPNDVFSRDVVPTPLPYLDGFSPAEQSLIINYVQAADIGNCPATFPSIRRPDFYFPQYQVQGVCLEEEECGLPRAVDHDFGQFCQPDNVDTIRIRALRWDCCYSFSEEGQYEYECGWRMVSVPIIRQCQCGCERTV